MAKASKGAKPAAPKKEKEKVIPAAHAGYAHESGGEEHSEETHAGYADESGAEEYDENTQAGYAE